MTKRRIAFMGTPEFSVPTLEALAHDDRFEVVAVYCQPPRPAGRGKELRASAVEIKANALGIPVFSPLSLKSAEAQADFAALDIACAVIVAYGLILPEAILEAPQFGCINIHASILPRWRGAAPIHRAIMAGDKETGISIMLMDKGLDTGPVLTIRNINIEATATTASLHDTLSAMGASMIGDAVSDYINGTLKPIPQPSEGVTYAQKIDKAEAAINWNKSAIEIDRLVRGLYPFPGAWFSLRGERIKVLEGQIEENKTGVVGTAINDRMLIACGDDSAYRITKAQRAGKAPLEIDEFLKGLKVPEGASLMNPEIKSS